MEKILSVALATASELYRRRLFLLLLLAGVGQVVALGLGASGLQAISQAVPQSFSTALSWQAYQLLATTLGFMERMGTFLAAAIFAGLLPADRQSGLVGFYLTQPLARWEYALGKLLGGVIVLSLFGIITQGSGLWFAWRYGGGVGPDVLQTAGLTCLRWLLAGQVVFLLSVRMGAVVSWLGGVGLFFLPLLAEAYLAGGGWLSWVLWPYPAFELFASGELLADRQVIAWWQYGGRIAYGGALSMLLGAASLWRMERLKEV